MGTFSTELLMFMHEREIDRTKQWSQLLQVFNILITGS